MLIDPQYSVTILSLTKLPLLLDKILDKIPESDTCQKYVLGDSFCHLDCSLIDLLPWRSATEVPIVSISDNDSEDEKKAEQGQDTPPLPVFPYKSSPEHGGPNFRTKAESQNMILDHQDAKIIELMVIVLNLIAKGWSKAVYQAIFACGLPGAAASGQEVISQLIEAGKMTEEAKARHIRLFDSHHFRRRPKVFSPAYWAHRNQSCVSFRLVWPSEFPSFPTYYCCPCLIPFGSGIVHPGLRTCF